MMKHIIYCQDSPEGILSAVYRAYESRYGHNCTELKAVSSNGWYDEEEFFARTEKDILNFSHAESVRNAILEKAGNVALDIVMAAAISAEADKADVIYHFIVRALANGPGTENFLTDEYVMRINRISRKAYNEAHHWKEFLRFREYHLSYCENEGINMIANKSVPTVLIAEIRPVSKVIPLIMDHFADRFNVENFIIYDSVHDEAGIYGNSENWFIVRNASESVTGLREMITASKLDSEEESMEKLWNAFFRSTAIKERYNKNLQRNLMPLYFRINKDLP